MPAPAPIELAHLFDIDFVIGAIHTVGTTPMGTRVIADLGGGRFEGERLRGRVLPSGGDWGLFMPDGTLRVDGRCCFETEDGAILYAIYKGRWKISPETMARLGEPGGVDPSEYSLRITFEFETTTGDYDWLNHIMAIARGRRTDDGIHYEVFEVR
jgi:hypothetical protein